MAEAARILSASAWSWAASAKMTLELYQELLDRRAPRRRAAPSWEARADALSGDRAGAMTSESPAISVVLITRNEAGRIRRCLESARWADELIVVDQHSTDGTAAICREYGATVLLREMSAGFGEQKQFAVEQASRPWILCLDADEVITPALRRAIEAAIREPGPSVGFKVPRLTSYLGRFIRRCGWYPSPVLRLFRRGRGRYTDALVHEEVRVDGPVGMLDQDLLHFSYETLSDHLRKLDLYTAYDARMLTSRGIRIQGLRGLWYLVGKPALAFFWKFLWQGGIFEGRHGLVLSAMAAFVVFVNYAKVWELTEVWGVVQPGGGGSLESPTA
jgi:glycosyltransferase involved in cell wall biosynthesis